MIKKIFQKARGVFGAKKRPNPQRAVLSAVPLWMCDEYGPENREDSRMTRIGSLFNVGHITAEFLSRMARGEINGSLFADKRLSTDLLCFEAIQTHRLPGLTDYDRQLAAYFVVREERRKDEERGLTYCADEKKSQLRRLTAELGKYGYRGRANLMHCANCDRMIAPSSGDITGFGKCTHPDCPAGVIWEWTPRPAIVWSRVISRCAANKCSAETAAIALDVTEDQIEEMVRRRRATPKLGKEYWSRLQEIVDALRDELREEREQRESSGIARPRLSLRTSRAAGIIPFSTGLDDEEIPPDMGEPSEPPTGEVPPKRKRSSSYPPPTRLTDEHQGNEAGTDAP